MTQEFDRLTIEPADKEFRKPMESATSGWWVIGHGVYERSSVLAGQNKWARVEHFDDLAEAKKSYPDAEVLDCSTRPMPGMEAQVPMCPPSDFDHYDCGEYWGEEDY